MKQIKALRGTKDIFGEEIISWQKLEKEIEDLCYTYGFNEIRTPVFEQQDLFQRGVGDTTDIVQKEMYAFTDKGRRDNKIALKPEGTASVVRAYLERKMYADSQPTKLYYITPAFRRERPQAGRQRQFHQFGIELIGSASPAADAEVISIADALLDNIGIKKVELHINSLGCKDCRQVYNKVLLEFLQEHKEDLCDLCQERMVQNPLRVLDCKNETCAEIVKDAPTTLESLGEECSQHFNQLKELLEVMEIPYIVDTGIVRGLDYYTRTVFEFISNDIGAQGTVCGGGRYDGLIEEIGGQPTPAVGFAAGMERLLLVQEAENAKEDLSIKRDIYIGTIGEEAKVKGFALVNKLRKNGISAEGDLMDRSVRAQMRYANRINARFSTIVGVNELEEGQVILKNMETGEDKKVEIDELVEELKNLL